MLQLNPLSVIVCPSPLPLTDAVVLLTEQVPLTEVVASSMPTPIVKDAEVELLRLNPTFGGVASRVILLVAV